MLFSYKAIESSTNAVREGSIEAVSMDVAVGALQRRGMVISSIVPVEQKKGFLDQGLGIFDRVSTKDLVILARQIATLFEAQVSALRIFRLLAAEIENPALAKVITEVADDLQGGSSISRAMSKHPKIFTEFFVSMVRAGEESGKLDQTFTYLADYLDRNYEVSSKAKNALIYPAFVVFTFITVMVLMLTMVIPKISGILLESGQDIPTYTKIVIGLSNFFVDYGVFLLVALIIGAFFLFRFVKTKTGLASFDKFKLSFPYVGTLYSRLYLSRIADNMNTMLSSGVSMVRALEISAALVGNAIYKDALEKSVEAVKGGASVSEALARTSEIPGIMIQMIKVGEETGNLGAILATLAKFYQREVTNAVDTIVGLIEPAMIVALAVGVGILLASVLVPIYNLSSGF